MKALYFFTLPTLVIVAIFLGSCSNKPRSPLEVQASIFPEPLVGREVTLQIEMLAQGRELPNTLLTVELSEGIELVAGELTWQGDLPKDEVVPFNLTIKVREAGEWTIYAYAFSSLSPNLGFGGSKKLYIDSSFDSAIVEVDRPMTAPPQMQVVTLPPDTFTPAPVSPLTGSPLLVTAELNPEALVGREVTLHVEMLAKGRDLPNTLLTVELSEGIELVAGELTWQGDLPKDEVVPFNLTIKVREAGERTIYAYAYADLGNSNGFGGGTLLEITSSSESASVVADRPLTAPPQMQVDDRGR